jgi:predicted ArsR family transcriptional regulator
VEHSISTVKTSDAGRKICARIQRVPWFSVVSGDIQAEQLMFQAVGRPVEMWQAFKMSGRIVGLPTSLTLPAPEALEALEAAANNDRTKEALTDRWSDKFSSRFTRPLGCQRI